ncbi:MAG: hypothetical protein IJW14_04935 [Oscillospiraceae bacterium]|nr:hypothetical protein [Oscillospiraceae bacterium]
MKKIITWIAAILVILLVVCGIQLWRGGWITSAQIERVEFRGCSSCEGPVSGSVELSRSEINKMVTYYNLAGYAGRVTGEDCDSAFGFTIYLKDGTWFSFREAGSPRIEVNPLNGEKYWITSGLLARYAQELIEKYELTVS